MKVGDALCLWCTGYIRHTDLIGWIHSDGRGPIWQRCAACNWTGSYASGLIGQSPICPSCFQPRLVDDHVATPDRREGMSVIESLQADVRMRIGGKL